MTSLRSVGAAIILVPASLAAFTLIHALNTIPNQSRLPPLGR